MLEPYLGRLTGDTDDLFTALSNASIEDGVFVHVPKGQKAISRCTSSASPRRLLSPSPPTRATSWSPSKTPR